MIENDQQLEGTYQALGCLYRALASLRKRVLPLNAKQYALFAEGPIDEIAKLQAEINTYLGLDQDRVLDDVQTTSKAVPALHETPPPFGRTQKD